MRKLHQREVLRSIVLFFFFFNDTATTEIYTLSLHDAHRSGRARRPSTPARSPGRWPHEHLQRERQEVQAAVEREEAALAGGRGMTYDPHANIFPDRLEVDVKAEAELAERHRVAEVEGLRRELEQLAAQREQLTTEKPVAEMVISDTRTGKRVPHLRVERISVGLAAERIEEGI